MVPEKNLFTSPGAAFLGGGPSGRPAERRAAVMRPDCPVGHRRTGSDHSRSTAVAVYSAVRAAPAGVRCTRSSARTPCVAPSSTSSTACQRERPIVASLERGRGHRQGVGEEFSRRWPVGQRRPGGGEPGGDVRLDLPVLPALVAQRIEHLTTDQKVGGSNPSERTRRCWSDRSARHALPEPPDDVQAHIVCPKHAWTTSRSAKR
jgi:hypothetical protein